MDFLFRVDLLSRFLHFFAPFFFSCFPSSASASCGQEDDDSWIRNLPGQNYCPIYWYEVQIFSSDFFIFLMQRFKPKTPHEFCMHLMDSVSRTHQKWQHGMDRSYSDNCTPQNACQPIRVENSTALWNKTNLFREHFIITTLQAL